MEKVFSINGNEVKVKDFSQKGDELSFVIEGKLHKYNLVDRNGPQLIIVNDNRLTAAVSTPNRDGECMVIAGGREALVSGMGKKMKKDRGHAGSLTSPMPGKIFKVLRPVGSVVTKGETILILEAMKMEHSIRADKDGKIKKISYQEGELVQGGVTLVELE